MTFPLPSLLVLTDLQTGCLSTLTQAIAGGARAIVLREKHLAGADRIELARRVNALLAPSDGTLIVASDPVVAAKVPTPWLHLAASDPVPPPGFMWGRSCHDEQEIKRAVAEGASYVTVSPVFATASKPGYGPVLGVDGLARMVTEAGDVPVYALGGVDPERGKACRAAGAYGMAVMGEIMRADDAEPVVRALL